MQNRCFMSLFGLVVIILFLTGCGSQQAEELIQQEANSFIASISVSPVEITLTVGQGKQFIVLGNYLSATVSSVILNPTWEVEGNIGEIDQEGIFEAKMFGYGKVTAKYDGYQASASVHVIENSISTWEETDTIPPDSPQGLTGKGYSETVFLSWSPVLVSDLAGYKVYRSSSINGEYVEVGLSHSVNFYDETVQQAKTYYYKLRAYDLSSNLSDFSEIIAVFVENNNIPLPPRRLTAEGGDQFVTLIWSRNAEEDISGYNIYRKDISDYEDNYVKVNSLMLSLTFYRDEGIENAHLYRYVVTAINTSGKESYYSNIIEVVPLPVGAQNHPPQISLNVSDGGLSPNGDGVKESVTIEYAINDDFSRSANYVRICITSGDGSNVKTIYVAGKVALPIQGQFVWDGTNDDNIKVTDGKYALRISLSDDTNQTSSDIYYVTVFTVPPLMEIIQERSTFSPNGDGKYDDVEFKVRSDKLGTIEFFLKNLEEHTLLNKEVSYDRWIHEQLKILWKKEGFELYRRNNENGFWEYQSLILPSEQLVDGNYRIVFSSTDLGGNVSTETYIVKYDTTIATPTITASLPKFSPNGDGRFDEVNFDVDIDMDEPGILRYRLKGPGYFLIDESILIEEENIGKLNKLVWNDKAFAFYCGDEIFSYIPYGSGGLSGGVHTLEVVAIDEVQNVSSPATIEVVVDLIF